MIDVDLAPAYADLLGRGYLLTVAISFGAIVFALFLAVPLAMLRLGASAKLAWIAVALVEAVRSLPFLVFLLLVHFSMPLIGYRTPAWASGLIALSLYGAAYFSEALRAAYRAVSRGQLEAAAALGLSRTVVLFRVIGPQMVAPFAPVARVNAIMLLKESAVLSIITVPELTHASLRIQAETFATVPTWITVALLYWSITAALATLFTRIERGLSIGAHRRSVRRSEVAARYLDLAPAPASSGERRNAAAVLQLPRSTISRGKSRHGTVGR